MKLDTQLQFAQNIKTLRLHKSMSQLQMAKEFSAEPHMHSTNQAQEFPIWQL